MTFKELFESKSNEVDFEDKTPHPKFKKCYITKTMKNGIGWFNTKRNPKGWYILNLTSKDKKELKYQEVDLTNVFKITSNNKESIVKLFPNTGHYGIFSEYSGFVDANKYETLVITKELDKKLK